jgi:phosphatidate cytidylyltransferase
MTKIVKRLLVFFIGVPAVSAIVIFLPFYNHLVVNILVILFSAAGAVEFSTMLAKKKIHITKIEAFIFGALAPLALTLTISFNVPEWIIPLMLMLGAGWILLSKIFTQIEKIDSVTGYITGGFAAIIYPGFFMFWLVKMTSWENPGIIILIFLFITFGSDSTAWLIGSLFFFFFRGIIAASPNKSIAGFLGGILGSVIVSTGASLIYPNLFIPRFDNIPVICMAIILGICTGVFAALGDLAESAIKRSCNFKDSGTLMFCRGGVLDSIDSIAAASPVFYLLFTLFFSP